MHKSIIKGQNVVIGKDVVIGDNTMVGNNVVIHTGSIIGKNVRIDDNAVIGKLPMRAKASATTIESKLPAAQIEDNCLIGTNTVIYRGATIHHNVLIADMTSIREDVSIGENTLIGKGATIENKVTIGKYCKIQSNVQLVPYSVIEDNVFIAPGVMTSNDRYAGRTKQRFKAYKGITVKKGARLGVGCITLPGVTIGEEAMVGGGSVVTRDIPPRKVAFGIPARVVRDVPEEQLLENQEY